LLSNNSFNKQEPNRLVWFLALIKFTGKNQRACWSKKQKLFDFTGGLMRRVTMFVLAAVGLFVMVATIINIHNTRTVEVCHQYPNGVLVKACYLVEKGKPSFPAEFNADSIMNQQTVVDLCWFVPTQHRNEFTYSELFRLSGLFADGHIRTVYDQYPYDVVKYGPPNCV
jgi:hypothetical protein